MKYGKKFFTLFICATICTSLTACGEGGQKKTVEILKPMLYSNTFAQKYVAPTEDGYYIIDNGALNFIDKKSGKEITVCNKPDCNHELNENCNATVDCDIELLTDENALYTQNREENGDIVFYKISMDASKHEKLYTVGNVPDDEEYSVPYIVENGYLYYVFENLDGEKEKNTTLCRRALEKNAEEEKVYSEKGYAVSFDDMQVYDHQIYFDVCGFQKPDEEGDILKLCKYDTATGKEQTVWKNAYGMYTKIGNLIYRQDEKGKLTSFSEQTGETAEIKTEENMFDVDLRTDGEYLYLFQYKNNTLRIIDTNGKQLAQLKNMPSYMVGADKNILVFQGDGNSFYSMYDRNEALKGRRKKFWPKE